MAKVRDTFESEIIDKSKLEIYKFHIPRGELALNRNYVDKQKFKEHDLVKVTITLLQRPRRASK